MPSASTVLRSMSPWHDPAAADSVELDAVAEQVTARLIEHGFQVDRHIGQSHFRCDLALRRPGDTEYRLGILIDTDAYYQQADLLERDLLRPRLLEAFGWRIEHVLAKDWYADADGVVERLVKTCIGE